MEGALFRWEEYLGRRRQDHTPFLGFGIGPPILSRAFPSTWTFYQLVYHITTGVIPSKPVVKILWL